MDARRAVEARPRPLADKRASLEEAATLVRDGDHVAIGGCLFTRTPMAMLRTILRSRPKRLTLSRSLLCFESDLFAAGGAVESFVTSWIGIGMPWGVSRAMREEVESGRVRFEEWSHLALGLRFRAAAMGVPFLPSLSLLGSDILAEREAPTMKDPFTGETVCLVPALYPDVALVHVHRADRFGNAQIDGPVHMDPDLARAARRVILTAEEIVEPHLIRATGDRTVIPYFTVDAVVHAPFGALPHECHGAYDADMESIDAYGRAVAERGGAAVREFLATWVDGPATHEAYLDLFRPRLESLRAAAREVLA